jgi:hypothetical protein
MMYLQAGQTSTDGLGYWYLAALCNHKKIHIFSISYNKKFPVGVPEMTWALVRIRNE